MQEIPIILWLAALPSDVFEKAVANIQREEKENPSLSLDGVELETTKFLYEAISCAFIWNKSPEGHVYWDKIYSLYRNKEILAS